ncbi:ATP-binding protein [Zwartia panacis]|uniref:ATP-binding protein n=1 Tax=Zwartia panacis TaxID=2683345 RepID=UPI0025B5BB75|nr:ATP-binding protein [Zwartia panacis]MDN4015508.1 ATP-binding protein [Zwartia panacis]
MSWREALSSGSLRRRLLTSIFVPLLIVWLALVLIAYDKGKHEAEELLDGQLSLSARLLEAQIFHEETNHTFGQLAEDGTDQKKTALIEKLDIEDRLPYEQELAFKISKESGPVILMSANALSMDHFAEPGFHLQEIDGTIWRIYVKKSLDKRFHLQVAHPLSSRELIGLDVAERIAIPLFFAFPILMLIMYVSVTRSIRPLDRVAESLSTRSVDNLSPVSDYKIPLELRSIIHAFNRLLLRVSESIKNERRFTSNAAHELRTPLAGTKLHAQLACATSDPVQKEQFMSQVLEGLDRSQRLIEQMLKLARLDPENLGQLKLDNIDIKTLLLEVQDTEAETLKRKNQNLVLDVSSSLSTIRADEELLNVALTNLVGNAARYSPMGTTIFAGSWAKDEQYGLYVQDYGPGINPEDLPTITQRFRRGTDVREEGTGLGLAIVERIASLHHAELILRNIPTGGLRAEIVWKLD